MRTTTTVWLAVSFALAVQVRDAHAQCPVNPTGGPSELILTVEDAGSDLDLGKQGRDFHNLPFPAGSQMRLCLSNCDPSTDALCTADGGAVTIAGQPLGAPLPLVAGGAAAVCLATRFSTAPNGTADMDFGVLDISATLNASVHLTFALNASTKICPRCSGAGVGAAGTCDSGANLGQACVVDDVVTVANPPPGGNPVYNVSADCLPSNPPDGSSSVSLSVGTAPQVLNGAVPCQGQPGSNSCGVNPCNAVCTAGANQGGITELCCANDTTLPCFPNPITRNGDTVAPTPLWPDPTYPKSSSEVLVGVFCVPGTGSAALDTTIGLPGPMALTLPVAGQWLATPTPPTTTTTTSGSTSTSVTTPGATTTTAPPQPCATPADCDDSDPCTDDQCNANLCANPVIPGIDGAQCLLGQINAPALCGSDPVHPKVLRTTTKKVAKAVKFLGTAETATSDPKRVKALKKVRAALQAILNKAAKFGTKGKITGACAQAIADEIGPILQLVPTT